VRLAADAGLFLAEPRPARSRRRLLPSTPTLESAIEIPHAAGLSTPVAARGMVARL
jgi:hypothetical protein